MFVCSTPRLEACTPLYCSTNCQPFVGGTSASSYWSGNQMVTWHEREQFTGAHMEWGQEICSEGRLCNDRVTPHLASCLRSDWRMSSSQNTQHEIQAKSKERGWGQMQGCQRWSRKNEELHLELTIFGAEKNYADFCSSTDDWHPCK